MKRNQKFLVFGLSLVFTLLSAWDNYACAFIAAETSPGIIELRSRRDQGLIVKSLVSRTVGRSKKKWIYFCVAERSSVRHLSSVEKEKCFYGRPSQFRNVQANQEYVSIEYGLKNRIYNNKGHISIGAQRYFYPVYVLYGLN